MFLWIKRVDHYLLRSLQVDGLLLLTQSRCYSVSTNLNFCPTEGAAATPALRVLPGSEAGSTEEVTARLYPDVFRVLRADLAELEG